jgi:hypothetical protein
MEATRKSEEDMGSYFPNERDLRYIQEAARVHEQLRSFDLHSHLYGIQDVLEQQRRIEQDLQAADAVRHLQEAAQLRHTLGASHLDLQRAAQQVLDQRERLRDTFGDETLAAAAIAAGRHVQATLDATRVADITKQLDVNYLARTLRRAQELLSDSTVADMLAQADAREIIRDAQEAMGTYPPSQSGEITVEPPEWLRRLSRENLVALVKLLELYVDTLLAVYFVVSGFTDANASKEEVEAVFVVLRVALGWARHMLEKSEDDG